jgi:integrase
MAGCATRRCSSCSDTPGCGRRRRWRSSGGTCASGTLLVERALSDGQLKALKSRRQPRTVTLLAPLIEDLDEWRDASAARLAAPLFPSGSGGFWRATDWRNWRKRVYRPTAQAVGIDSARPSDLRHAFASLLIHEGRMSVVEIAAQLGHNPTVCLAGRCGRADRAGARR